MSESDFDELPAEFRQRLRDIVPEPNRQEVWDSFRFEKKFAFRVNTLVAPREQTLCELNELGVEYQAIDWLQDNHQQSFAFWADRNCRESLTHGCLVDQGKVYLQNLSSMIAPWVLQVQPGESVLDLAAAPGGKTTQLAQLMNNQGQLSAVEAIRNRMFKLTANLKRCGVTICKTYLTDGRTVGKKTPERFDRVLLDAPCSSESRFRIDEPDSWSTWSLRKLRETSRKQIGLLKAAIHATRIGGVILYCTCSFAPEENEQVVDKVLSNFGTAIELEPITVPIPNIQPGLVCFQNQEFDPRLQRTMRILPNQINDAFFMARIRKLGSTRARDE